MINKIFELCVNLLVWMAELVGMTYREINVWIFCVIWPILHLATIWYALWLRKRLKKMELRKEVENSLLDRLKEEATECP